MSEFWKNQLMTKEIFSEIVEGYIEAAYFSCFEECNPENEISEEAKQASEERVRLFISKMTEATAKYLFNNSYRYTFQRLGNDILFETTGAGVGFRDRAKEGLIEGFAMVLCSISYEEGIRNDNPFYIGDDGFVYPY